jgi:glycerophosphoryl diester phosphodiesterase
MPRFSRLLPVIIAVAAVVCGFAADIDSTPGTAIDIVAHRGGAGLMPENTMPAFRRALELEVASIEIDLRLTADGVLAVHHDDKLSPERCVGVDGKRAQKRAIAELNWEAVRAVECAGPPGSNPARASIPRLEQVLSMARDARYPVHLNLEIKKRKRSDPAAYDEIATILANAVREHGLQDRVIVQSFAVEPLLAVHRAAPELRLGVIVRAPDRYAAMLEESGTTTLFPRHDRLRESDVSRFQAEGVRVVPWTVNKPEAMRRMMRWGVDGLITDYPDRARAVAAEEGQDPTERGGQSGQGG